MSEIRLQASCFQWLWNNHPETRLCCFHVPNGGSRNAIEGMQLKASGVVAGVADILFIWKGKIHAFEFKTPTGTVSQVQSKVHSAWAMQGITVQIIRSFEQWREEVEKIIN